MMDDRCLICGGAIVVTCDPIIDVRFGVPGAFSVCRCQSCGLEQTAPRLSSGELSRAYGRYYNFEDSDRGSYARRRHLLVRTGAYRAWVRLDGDVSFVLGPPGADRRLLDVGCNEGRNLSLFARRGFDAHGVESNPVAVRRARQQDLKVHEGDVGDIPTSERFDVVVMSNVLEHLEDPLGTLRQVAERLNPEGELWISCPNSRSWARRLFGPWWINWHPPFHLTHFSEHTLTAVLDRAGFTVEEVRTRTPALWLVQSALAWRYAKPGEPTLQMRRPLLLAALLVTVRAGLFPLLWLANRMGRGDCLVVRAKRDGS